MEMLSFVVLSLNVVLSLGSRLFSSQSEPKKIDTFTTRVQCLFLLLILLAVWKRFSRLTSHSR